MTPLAALDGATARLGRQLVLSGATLSIASGELVCVCGPNGAGKTSALKALVGLIRLETGQAELGGEAVRALTPRQRASRVAYLPQERRIAWNLPAVQVAALGAPFLSLARAEARARTALAEVGLGALAERGVADMSGGERARVLLARLLTAEAPLLVADEPLAGLDPDAALLALDRLRARARGGGGVLVSLHDLTLAAQHADRIVVLSQGRVIADGAPMRALSPELLKLAFGVRGAWVDGPDGPLLAVRRA